MNEIEKAKDVKQLNLQKVWEWLSGEIEIRLARLWLVGTGATLLILMIVALD